MSFHGEGVVQVKDTQEYTVMFINIKNGSNPLQCAAKSNVLMMVTANLTNLNQRNSLKLELRPEIHRKLFLD